MFKSTLRECLRVFKRVFESTLRECLRAFERVFESTLRECLRIATERGPVAKLLGVIEYQLLAN